MFAVGRPSHHADFRIEHLHVDGLFGLGGAPEREAPVASGADEIFAARLPREAVDAFGVAAQHDGPRAFGTFAAEIPEHDFIAGARSEIAAVVAPSHEFELAVIPTHL